MVRLYSDGNNVYLLSVRYKLEMYINNKLYHGILVYDKRRKIIY